MRIIKLQPDTLNEEFSSMFGMANDNNGYAGFSFELKPLSFNLEQKSRPLKQMNDYKIHVGQHVKGTCLYDNKTHKGLVKYLYWDGSDSKEPKAVYILDMDINAIVPLKPNTVKICKNEQEYDKAESYFDKNPNKIQYDFRSPNVLY